MPGARWDMVQPYAKSHMVWQGRLQSLHGCSRKRFQPPDQTLGESIPDSAALRWSVASRAGSERESRSPRRPASPGSASRRCEGRRSVQASQPELHMLGRTLPRSRTDPLLPGRLRVLCRAGRHGRTTGADGRQPVAVATDVHSPATADAGPDARRTLSGAGSYRPRFLRRRHAAPGPTSPVMRELP